MLKRIMPFRIATLNLAQNQKRLGERRRLIAQQLIDLKPDVFTMNEIWLPLGVGQWVKQVMDGARGANHTLIQSPRKVTEPDVEAEGILSGFRVVEQARRFYAAQDSVMLAARLEITDHLVDIYVTHLYASRVDDSLRVGLVEQLIDWIHERDDIEYRIICGDFNARLDMPSAKLMAEHFRPTQTQPTAFTPLQEPGDAPTHPEWERLDRCIDFIWISNSINLIDSGRCFDKADEADQSLWPSDHIGVWADLEFIQSEITNSDGNTRG